MFGISKGRGSYEFPKIFFRPDPIPRFRRNSRFFDVADNVVIVVVVVFAVVVVVIAVIVVVVFAIAVVVAVIAVVVAVIAVVVFGVAVVAVVIVAATRCQKIIKE